MLPSIGGGATDPAGVRLFLGVHPSERRTNTTSATGVMGDVWMAEWRSNVVMGRLSSSQGLAETVRLSDGETDGGSDSDSDSDSGCDSH
jgi:hypothetical protein